MEETRCRSRVNPRSCEAPGPTTALERRAPSPAAGQCSELRRGARRHRRAWRDGLGLCRDPARRSARTVHRHRPDPRSASNSSARPAARRPRRGDDASLTRSRQPHRHPRSKAGAARPTGAQRRRSACRCRRRPPPHRRSCQRRRLPAHRHPLHGRRRATAIPVCGTAASGRDRRRRRRLHLAGAMAPSSPRVATSACPAAPA